MFKKSLLFLVLSAQICFSQFKNLQNFDERDIRFGYYIGINSYDNKVDYKQNTPYPISVDRAEGINVGLIGELKLNKNLFLSLEPGLHANKKNIIFKKINNQINNPAQYSQIKKSIARLYTTIKNQNDKKNS